MEQPGTNRRCARHAALAAALMMTAGCDDQEGPLANLSDAQQEIVEVLRDGGYRISDIAILDGEVVVQGDIVVTLAAARGAAAAREASANQFRHWRQPNIVTVDAGTICVVKTDNTTKSWANYPNLALQLEEGLARWNAVGLRYNFTTQVEGVDCKATIKAFVGNFGKEEADGMGTFPQDGQPGEKFFVSHEQEKDKPDNIIATFMHEIGHTMGLRHSDWDDNDEDQDGAVWIPGTPDCAPVRSVMNSDPEWTPGKFQSEWTKDDLVALRELYGQ